MFTVYVYKPEGTPSFFFFWKKNMELEALEEILEIIEEEVEIIFETEESQDDDQAEGK